MPEDSLSPEAVAWLQTERLVIVASASAAGDPASHVVSWAVAVDARTVRLAVRHAALAVAHVRETGRLAIEVIGDGIAVGARGSASVIVEHMTQAPQGNAMVELRIEEVVSHLPRGMALRGPSWDVPPERTSKAAERTAAIFAELWAGAPR